MVQIMDHIEFRVATREDAAVVLSVLDDAAAWLASRGIQQWPSAFAPVWILPDIEAGRTWLAVSGSKPVATVTLGWSDPLWPDDERAGYVHRLARVRAAPALGDQLLAWVTTQVDRQRRDLIRLDCVATNSALRTYYERRGFHHRRDAVVGGAPGERTTTGTKTLVSLYERTVSYEGQP
jgi:hypothetical protein